MANFETRRAAATAAAPLEVQLDAALAAASRFLVERQSPDGAWRSDVYAPFKEGDALTPLVLATLGEVSGAGINRPAIERGTAYLAGMVREDGTIVPPRYGLAYSVYTAAGAVISLSQELRTLATAAHPDQVGIARLTRVRNVWLEHLRASQLTEKLGWQPSDEFYGGWGYASTPPRKPGDGAPLAPLAQPNLSATVMALEALSVAGVKRDSPEVEKALRLARRYQNYPRANTRPASPLDDGGFFFVADDPVRNKAGVIDAKVAGAARFASYGSTTADGLRALMLRESAADHDRTRAAWNWILNNFSAGTHPGHYQPDREAARPALYFYYCRSMSKALTIDATDLGPNCEQRLAWARDLAAELLRRQNADGSWQNAAVDVREDDPLVATCLAAQALAACRQVMAGR